MFFGVPTAQVVSLLFIVPSVAALVWRHRSGRGTDDPPTHPELATWGALGRPVDPEVAAAKTTTNRLRRRPIGGATRTNRSTSSSRWPGPTDGRARDHPAAPAALPARGSRPKPWPRPEGEPSKGSPGSVARPNRGLAPLSGPAAARPLRALRRRSLPDPDRRPAPSAARRVSAGRGGPPRLDGSVRGDACAPGRAPCLVPRQCPIDLHVALSRAPDPRPRRAAAGLARRYRRGPARRFGAGRGRQRRRLRPDARGHRQRAARPARAVPDGLGGDRTAHGCLDRAPRDGRDRGALSRSPDGVADPAAHHGPGAGGPRGLPTRCRPPARARSWRSRAG